MLLRIAKIDMLVGNPAVMVGAWMRRLYHYLYHDEQRDYTIASAILWFNRGMYDRKGRVAYD